MTKKASKKLDRKSTQLIVKKLAKKHKKTLHEIYNLIAQEYFSLNSEEDFEFYLNERKNHETK